MSHSPEQIILYGGTFDPPHAGHLLCMQEAAATFPRAQLWMIPAYMPPKIPHGIKDPLFSFEARVALCERFVVLHGLGDRVRVSAVEKDLPIPSYSLQMVEYFRAHFPQTACKLLLGSDQFAHFQKWDQPKKIIENAELVVVCRYSGGNELPILEKVATELQARERILFLHNAYCPAQSTWVRKALATGEEIPASWHVLLPEGPLS